MGMLTRPGHGVPGIHGGDGVGVGAGVGTGVGDGVGAGVGERVGDGEGEGDGSAPWPTEPQAVRRAAVAKASANATARRARQRPLSPARRASAFEGVLRRRVNMAETIEPGLLAILLEITPGGGRKESASLAKGAPCRRTGRRNQGSASERLPADTSGGSADPRANHHEIRDINKTVRRARMDVGPRTPLNGLPKQANDRGDIFAVPVPVAGDIRTHSVHIALQHRVRAGGRACD